MSNTSMKCGGHYENTSKSVAHAIASLKNQMLVLSTSLLPNVNCRTQHLPANAADLLDPQWSSKTSNSESTLAAGNHTKPKILRIVNPSSGGHMRPPENHHNIIYALFSAEHTRKNLAIHCGILLAIKSTAMWITSDAEDSNPWNPRQIHGPRSCSMVANQTNCVFKLFKGQVYFLG